MVHVKTYVPGSDTATVAAPLLALLNELMPGPDVFVHTPVPMAGVFPPKDPLVSDPQIF